MAASSNENRFLYNLSSPEIIILPSSVSEISGIVYAEDNQVYAIDDEQGSLFRIGLKNEPGVEQWPVSKKKDYEDLVLAGGMFYLLSSAGSVVYFPHQFPISNVQEAELPIKGRNEFEILFQDPSANQLLMMCKSCKGDKKNEVSVYAFDLSKKSFDEKAITVLDVKEIEQKLGTKVGQFKPSAANVHPQTRDIYIVSSINQLLVVTDQAFHVKDVHKLEGSLFKQPEGLSFTPSGDLLISNEAAGTGNANILLFRQQK